MFRESDYQYPVLHSTYAKKDIPAMQLNAQLSALADQPLSARDRCIATTHDVLPMAIPTTFDTI